MIFTPSESSSLCQHCLAEGGVGYQVNNDNAYTADCILLLLSVTRNQSQ